MLWLDDLADWDGSVPAALVATDLTRAMRHDLLRRMAARALACPAGEVAISHREGRGPRVERPEGGPMLHVSLASRGRVSALAVASCPVGIDVEVVDPAGEVPWAVLHLDERADLDALAPERRAAAFARLWTLKEAYLKALRWGLAREPAGFRIRFLDETGSAVADPDAPRPVREATTIWRGGGTDAAAISAVLLAVD